MAGLATIGVKMGYKSSGETAYTDIPNMQEVPELGGDPEKIDVTVLTDTVKKYINGVKDYGDLEFTFLYDPDVTPSAFRIFKSLEGEADTEYQVTFPDGTTFNFTADVSVRTNEIKVNDAITFTAAFAMQSDVETTLASN